MLILYISRGFIMSNKQQEIYARTSSRLATFQTFPKKTLSPKLAAHAGFYYTGIEDALACFHCEGILDNWQEDDDVYLEHLIHFPNCAYICHQWGALATAKIRQVQSFTNVPFEIQRGFIYTKLLGRKLCIVCFKSEVQAALYPCGHAFWCTTCSDSLSICPKCTRQVIARLNVAIN